MKTKLKESSLIISDSIGRVSALTMTPPEPQAALAVAHGAGAAMTHRFMESLAEALALLSIATVRFNFAYVENGRKRPDPPAIAEKTVEKAIEFAHDLFPHLPFFAGGKSFGGRMTSQYLSKACPPFMKGVVFYGFPLHPSGAPSVERAKHLTSVHIPMLFLQGTRDTLAEMPLIEGVCEGLPSARLIKFEGADHSFNRGKTDNVPLLAEATATWMRECSI